MKNEKNEVHKNEMYGQEKSEHIFIILKGSLKSIKVDIYSNPCDLIGKPYYHVCYKADLSVTSTPRMKTNGMRHDCKISQ